MPFQSTVGLLGLPSDAGAGGCQPQSTLTGASARSTRCSHAPASGSFVSPDCANIWAGAPAKPPSPAWSHTRTATTLRPGRRAAAGTVYTRGTDQYSGVAPSVCPTSTPLTYVTSMSSRGPSDSVRSRGGAVRRQVERAAEPDGAVDREAGRPPSAAAASAASRRPRRRPARPSPVRSPCCRCPARSSSAPRPRAPPGSARPARGRRAPGRRSRRPGASSGTATSAARGVHASAGVPPHELCTSPTVTFCVRAISRPKWNATAENAERRLGRAGRPRARHVRLRLERGRARDREQAQAVAAGGGVGLAAGRALQRPLHVRLARRDPDLARPHVVELQAVPAGDDERVRTAGRQRRERRLEASGRVGGRGRPGARELDGDALARLGRAPHADGPVALHDHVRAEERRQRHVGARGGCGREQDERGREDEPPGRGVGTHAARR